MFANNPALAVKAKTPKDEIATVTPVVEVIERDGQPVVAMYFTSEDIAKARQFTAKDGKKSQTAGFRVEASVSTDEGTYTFNTRWMGIQAKAN